MKNISMTLLMTLLILAIPSLGFSGEPIITWNTIKISIPPGYYVQYFSKNSITIYPKDNNFKAHVAIEYNDVSERLSIINSAGKNEGNCTVNFINDIIFHNMNAFEWRTDCPSVGSRKCITVPNQKCEICFYGDKDNFYALEHLLNSISFK